MTHWRHSFFFGTVMSVKETINNTAKENKTDHYVIIYDLILAQNSYFFWCNLKKTFS